MKMQKLIRTKQLLEEGQCVSCGKKTEAKLLRYCDSCYEKEKARMARESLTQEYNRLFAISNIPPRAHNVFLEKVKPTSGQKEIVEFLLGQIDSFDHDRWHLPYLFGGVGVGKSLLAVAAANTAMLNKGASVFYLHVSNLMNDLEYFRENKQNILGCDFLILDDLGHHNVSEYTINLLFTILNDRMSGNHGTMIVSNFTADEFVNKTISKGIPTQTVDAIRDRISSMCVPMELVGENVRMRKATQRAWKKTTA